MGVQGLADAFILMRMPFDSPEARALNKQIFETIYHGALEASCEAAKADGTYETYPGGRVYVCIFPWVCSGCVGVGVHWDSTASSASLA